MSDEAYTGRFVRHLELNARGALPEGVTAPAVPESINVTTPVAVPNVNGEPLVGHAVRSWHQAALAGAQPN